MIINTLTQKKPKQNVKLQTFASGDLMTLEPNHYWLLQQGIVKTCTWTEEGTPITLGYWGEDDLIGQPLSLVYPYQVKCLTTVHALSIPLEYTSKITDLIQSHIQQTEEVLCILRSHKVYQRLRRILVWLSHKFGQEMEIGQLIDLRLTHQELAELVGATRVTVTKLINQLEQEGFLSRPERNAIVIHQSL
ncbi:MAG: Crp/Fnr family transcriptional regulator [Cyanobacteria bacterium P01_G01_bin.67]